MANENKGNTEQDMLIYFTALFFKVGSMMTGPHEEIDNRAAFEEAEQFVIDAKARGLKLPGGDA